MRKTKSTYKFSEDDIDALVKGVADKYVIQLPDMSTPSVEKTAEISKEASFKTTYLDNADIGLYDQFDSALRDVISKQGPGFINLVAKDIEFVKDNFLKPWSRNISSGRQHRVPKPSSTSLVPVSKSLALNADGNEILPERKLPNMRDNIAGSIFNSGVINTIHSLEEINTAVNRFLAGGGETYAIYEFIGDFPKGFGEDNSLDSNTQVMLSKLIAAIRAIRHSKRTFILLSSNYFTSLISLFPSDITVFNFDTVVNSAELLHHTLQQPDDDGKPGDKPTVIENIMFGNGTPEDMIYGFYDRYQSPAYKWFSNSRVENFITHICADVALFSSSMLSARSTIQALLDSCCVAMERPDKPFIMTDDGSKLEWGNIKRRVVDVNLVRKKLHELRANATTTTKAPRWRSYGPEDLVPVEQYAWYSAEARGLLSDIEDVVISRMKSSNPARIPTEKSSLSIQTKGYLEQDAKRNDATLRNTGEGLAAERLHEDASSESLTDEVYKAKLSKATSVRSPNFFFLWGPPGIGKSVLVHAVTNAIGRLDPEGDWREVSINLNESTSSYHNESSRLIRETLSNIESLTNTIVLLDEFANLFTTGDDTHNATIAAGERRVNSDIQAWMDHVQVDTNILADRGIIIIATGNTFVSGNLPTPIRSRMKHVYMDEPAPYDFYAYTDLANAVFLQATDSKLSLFKVAAYWNYLPGGPGGNPIPTRAIDAAPSDVNMMGGVGYPDAAKETIGRKNIAKLMTVVVRDLIRQELLTHNSTPTDRDNLKRYIASRGDPLVEPPKKASLGSEANPETGMPYTDEEKLRMSRDMYVGINGRNMHQAITEFVTGVKHAIEDYDEFADSGVDGEAMSEAYDKASVELRRRLSPQALYDRLIWAARASLNVVRGELRGHQAEERSIVSRGTVTPKFLNNVVFGYHPKTTPWDIDQDGGVNASDTNDATTGALGTNKFTVPTAEELANDSTEYPELFGDDDDDDEIPLTLVQTTQSPRGKVEVDNTPPATPSNQRALPAPESTESTESTEPTEPTESTEPKKIRGRPRGLRKNKETGEWEYPNNDKTAFNLSDFTTFDFFNRRKSANDRKRYRT